MARGIAQEVNPYPGLGPFQDRDEDRLLFFGREDEQVQLLNLVLSERLTLLFSRSGLGKSSLINTALLDDLRKRNYFPVVVRLTNDPVGGPIGSVYACIEREASKCSVQVDTPSHQDSLWEYFCGTKCSRNGQVLRPILILDQFEELFTVIRPQKDWEKTFANQLADMVRGRVPEGILKEKMEELERLPEGDPQREQLVSIVYGDIAPDVRILISMREDFLAELESLRDQIPGIFRNAMRLEPLKMGQARRAIELPSQQAAVLGNDTFTFGPGVVDAMLGFLSRQRMGRKLAAGDTVEPAHLQVLCHHLNSQRRKNKATQISIEDLKGTRGMKRIIGNYYRTVILKFPRLRLGWNSCRYNPSAINLLLFNRPRSAIRKLCEHGLIAGFYRNSLMVDVIKHRYGVPERDLSDLVNERLLRTEPRLGSQFYELSHDALVEPLIMIRRSKRLAQAIAAAAVFALTYAAATYVVVREGHRKFDEEQIQIALRKAQAAATQQQDDADQELREGLSQDQAMNWDEALKYYNSALHLYISLSDRRGQASVYDHIGSDYTCKYQYSEAISNHNKALEIHNSLQDIKAVGDDQMWIGVDLSREEHHGSALKYFIEAEGVYQTLGSEDQKAGQAWTLREQGYQYILLGDTEADSAARDKDYSISETRLNQSQSFYSQLEQPEPGAWAVAELDLGVLESNRGDYGRSKDLIKKAWDILHDNGDLYDESLASLYLGLALFRNGNRADAFKSYQAALSGFQKIHENRLTASTLMRIAQWHVEQGSCDTEGLEDASKAIRLAEQAKDQYTVMNAESIRAEAYLCAQSPQNAAEDAKRGLDDSIKLGSKSWQAVNLAVLGRVAAGNGDFQSAIENGQKAVDLYDLSFDATSATALRADLNRWKASLAANGGTNQTVKKEN